jgi:tellurite resistance protein
MSIKFEQPVQAFVAVAAAVVGADGVGSLEERNALFGKVKNLKVFEGLSEAEFKKLLNEMTDRVFSTVSADATGLAPETIDAIAAAAKAILSPEQRKDVQKMAVEISGADGQGQEERALLDRLARGLGVG